MSRFLCQLDGLHFNRAVQVPKLNAGFTGCGKTGSGKGKGSFVTGHDFSRADEASKMR